MYSPTVTVIISTVKHTVCRASMSYFLSVPLHKYQSSICNQTFTATFHFLSNPQFTNILQQGAVQIWLLLENINKTQINVYPMPLRCYNENTRILILKIFNVLQKKNWICHESKVLSEGTTSSSPLVHGLTDCGYIAAFFSYCNDSFSLP